MASAKRKKRMASQKTDLYIVKKNVPHNEEIEHRTLNKDLDHKKNEIEKIYLKFPGMLKEEVTWTAVAAIGGAAIVFWNVIKYIIILYNSFMLYGKTNVPMYLLVMRRNISFSDAYIFYLTAIAIFYCFAGTKYNPFPKIKGKYLIPMGAIFLLIMIFFQSSINLFHLEKYRYFIRGLGDYLFPLLAIIIVFFYTANENNTQFYKKIDADDEINGFYKELEKNMNSMNRILFFGQLIIIISAIGLVLSSTAVNHYYQIDQDNRLIVADLGERYIVVDTDYKIDEQVLYIDNSHYNSIDSSFETVRVIENVIIKPMS